MVISEFQQALIGAGAAAVLGVWAYNRWQEYRHRKAAEKIFRDSQPDVLIEQAADSAADEISGAELNERIDPRIEPVFTSPQDDEVSGEAVGADEMDGAAAPAGLTAAPSNDAPGEEFIDPMIELGLALPPDQSVAVLQAAWRETNADCHKRIRWVGRAAGNGEWIEIDDPSVSAADHAYVAIQLADRQGAIGEVELRSFCQVAEAITAARGGQVAIPALDEILAHAHDIDDVCAAVDIQIAIHIVSRAGQAFAGTKLRGLLEATGLQLAADGLFYLIGAEGGRLFSVSNSGAAPFDLEQMRTGSTSGITFWLDVPRVGNGAAVFDTMLAAARQLAEALDGMLVDDQHNPLGNMALATIRAKVVELQAQMAAHGIPAGGRRALRLFA
ncbi:Cell division protein ZipA [Georgfuchsia toluolica]|uniref:Cell division protein ZipA n=1 Tax=Georgfuchsia toluolica TaxID=424218 RepID=A0A916J7G8_9PROT|nr:cell division protein ZipA C-terminal FtsZ-binding domain-containing protein [Georgfuchsia toluolica]CAG4883821.1 Cell division protein ZipA [Georgfuchsia toluolica]